MGRKEQATEETAGRMITLRAKQFADHNRKRDTELRQRSKAPEPAPYLSPLSPPIMLLIPVINRDTCRFLFLIINSSTR
jgi:hypothetical protein